MVAVTVAAEDSIGNGTDHTQAGDVVILERIDGDTALSGVDGEAGMAVPGDLHRCHTPKIKIFN
jgi:hypothetical protein